jgi:hypothetical protein
MKGERRGNLFQRANRAPIASIARPDMKNLFGRANRRAAVRIARWNTSRGRSTPPSTFIAAFSA